MMMKRPQILELHLIRPKYRHSEIMPNVMKAEAAAGRKSSELHLIRPKRRHGEIMPNVTKRPQKPV